MAAVASALRRPSTLSVLLGLLAQPLAIPFPCHRIQSCQPCNPFGPTPLMACWRASSTQPMGMDHATGRSSLKSPRTRLIALSRFGLGDRFVTNKGRCPKRIDRRWRKAKLLTSVWPVHDAHRLHRLPSCPHQVLEAETIHRGLSGAIRSAHARVRMRLQRSSSPRDVVISSDTVSVEWVSRRGTGGRGASGLSSTGR